MKGFKKCFLLILTVSMVVGSLYTTGWTGERWAQDDPMDRDGVLLIWVLPELVGLLLESSDRRSSSSRCFYHSCRRRSRCSRYVHHQTLPVLFRSGIPDNDI